MMGIFVISGTGRLWWWDFYGHYWWVETFHLISYPYPRWERRCTKVWTQRLTNLTQNTHKRKSGPICEDFGLHSFFSQEENCHILESLSRLEKLHHLRQFPPSSSYHWLITSRPSLSIIIFAFPSHLRPFQECQLPVPYPRTRVVAGVYTPTFQKFVHKKNHLSWINQESTLQQQLFDEKSSSSGQPHLVRKKLHEIKVFLWKSSCEWMDQLLSGTISHIYFKNRNIDGYIYSSRNSSIVPLSCGKIFTKSPKSPTVSFQLPCWRSRLPRIAPRTTFYVNFSEISLFFRHEKLFTISRQSLNVNKLVFNGYHKLFGQ